MTPQQLQADQLGEIRNLWITKYTPEQRDDLAYLARTVDSIGPNARRILKIVASRLEIGAKQYGDFRDDRSLKAESVPELADAVIYLLGDLLMVVGEPAKAAE